MASSPKKSINESECVLCCDDIEFSACGACDHPICLKCCVKLRLLRKENDCPVCRSQLKEVIVSKGYKLWSDKSSRTQPRQHLRNFGIYHETPESQTRVNELLQYKCPKCGEVFKTFPLLKDHVKRVHMSFYCDICLKHLRIFTHERKCYTREVLVKHRRHGDLDDKSHRGHPQCRFCDERYLDNDELLAHLRKNHFWCHLCEKDGSQDYYPNYKELRRHFRESHFLCEEGECLHEKFTSVFRMKIDFQAHKAQKHSDKLSKAEARQVRQVDIAITFAPRQMDSANVVSSRDYSFPEPRNERYGGRRPGNRERAMGATSGFGGRDSFVREGIEGARPVRTKVRDRDSERVARNPELDKRDRDSGRTATGLLQDNARAIGSTPKDTAHERRRDKDLERTSRDTPHDQRGKKDAEGISRDNQQDKRRYHEKPSREENYGKKLNDSMGNRNDVVTSKGVEPNLVQDSVDRKKSKNDVTGEGSSVGSKNTTTVKKVAAISDSAPKQDKLKDKVSKSVVNPGVNGIPQDTKNYNTDYPALAQMQIQPQCSIVVQPAQSYEKQYPTLPTKNNNAVVSSTVKTPAPKRTYQNEFPTLSAITNGHGKSISARSVPPGLPPPGLQSPRQPPARPPPGMKWNAPPNLALQGASAHESGGNIGGRNQKLIKNIQYILNYRGQSFQRFQKISGLFRNGLTSAESYYRECCGLLGEENTRTVFRELIDLLPDEEKQRQLLSVYNDAKIRAKRVKPASPDAGEPVAGEPVAGEPVAGEPVTGSHSENDVGTSSVVSLEERDFPALPKSSGERVVKSRGQKSGAWVRGR